MRRCQCYSFAWIRFLLCLCVSVSSLPIHPLIHSSLELVTFFYSFTHSLTIHFVDVLVTSNVSRLSAQRIAFVCWLPNDSLTGNCNNTTVRHRTEHWLSWHQIKCLLAPWAPNRMMHTHMEANNKKNMATNETETRAIKSTLSQWWSLPHQMNLPSPPFGSMCVRGLIEICPRFNGRWPMAIKATLINQCDHLVAAPKNVPN